MLVVAVQLAAKTKQGTGLQHNAQISVMLSLLVPNLVKADARRPAQRQDGDVRLEERSIGVRANATARVVSASE